jgi:hypothetical protein
VKLHIKRGDESQFLYETKTDIPLSQLVPHLVRLFNGRLKVDRLCQEIELLSEHGTMLPPDMMGLTEEQVKELRLHDQWAESCVPSGGAVVNPDPTGRRNGQAPNDKMKDVLKRTVSEAKSAISKTQVNAGVCMTDDIIQDALDKLRGAVTIVYPMDLPPHDPIRLEFEGQEDLSGTQAGQQVLEEDSAQLWWAGKELDRAKLLRDFVGRNEKTKIVAKLQKKGQGAPAREPVVSTQEQKAMMAFAHKKQEEMKSLETDVSDDYLNAEWADPTSLKKQFTGAGNISWRPK